MCLFRCVFLPQGSVLQMYSISCNGLDQHSSIVEVQCAAVPLDCSKPSLIDPATGGSISSVVSDYLSSLDMSTPQPQMVSTNSQSIFMLFPYIFHAVSITCR